MWLISFSLSTISVEFWSTICIWASVNPCNNNTTIDKQNITQSQKLCYYVANNIIHIIILTNFKILTTMFQNYVQSFEHRRLVYWTLHDGPLTLAACVILAADMHFVYKHHDAPKACSIILI